MVKKVTFKKFKSILLNVRVIEKGIPVAVDTESKVYLDFHSERYYKTYALLLPFLNEESQSILDIGLNPMFTTVLSFLTPSCCTGVWGGHRLDNAKDNKGLTPVATRCCGNEYVIPIYNGYDLESDDLPFDDNSFDFVFFLEVIEHFIIDPIHALKELARVLKPKGRLVLTTDNANCFVKLIKFLTMKSIYWPYNDKMFGDRHNREYLKSEIQLILRGIGYRDVHVYLENLSPYAHGKHPLAKKIGYALSNLVTCFPFFSRFKRQIFAYAQKGSIHDFYPGWLFMRRKEWLETYLV